MFIMNEICIFKEERLIYIDNNLDVGMNKFGLMN